VSGTLLLTLLVFGLTAVCRAWIGSVPRAGTSGPDMVPMLFPMSNDESSSPPVRQRMSMLTAGLQFSSPRPSAGNVARRRAQFPSSPPRPLNVGHNTQSSSPRLAADVGANRRVWVFSSPRAAAGNVANHQAPLFFSPRGSGCRH